MKFKVTSNANKSYDLFIILDDLTAEGCPILALNLIDEFKKKNLKILLLRFRENNNELLKEFKKRKIEIFSYKLKDYGLFRYLKIINLTFKLSNKFKPSSILCFPLGWHSFVAIGAKLAGIKNVCTHVGNLALDVNNINFWKFKLLINLGYPFTNKFICCSKYVKNSLIKNLNLNLKSSKIQMIYNCYNNEKFKFKKKNLLNEKINNHEEIIIAMVGRFEIHKDQETLIKAISLLKEQGIKVKLLLIGDGSKLQILKKLVDNLNLINEILFLGALNEVDKILETVDIFVLSTTKYEGFGIAIAEAMGKGIPIIASDIGCCREILLDGKCGTLVKANSDISLANGVMIILKNIKVTEAKRQKAYSHCLKNFNKEKMSMEYIKKLEITH